MPASVRTALLLSVVLAASTLPHTLTAQGYPFSQRSQLTQQVALTEIRIEYGRPTARGRTLFGALVPWDSIWHPGADLATQITVSRDIVIEAQALPKGTYTMWLIPRAQGAWTFIFNRARNVQHTPYPGAASELLRLDVMPDQASHLETMTYQFPMVLRDEAILRLQWGTTGINLRIKAPYKPE